MFKKSLLVSLFLTVVLITTACEININFSGSVGDTPKDDQAKVENLLTFQSDKYGYKFKYPEGAEVSEISKDAFSLTPEQFQDGLTVEDLFRQYGGQICVTVHNEGGYVTFATPETERTGVICMRSGVGNCSPGINNGSIENISEIVNINEKDYAFSGVETICPDDTVPYSISMRATMDDGNKIEFGYAGADGEIETQEEFLEIKNGLLDIVKSYRLGR